MKGIDLTIVVVLGADYIDVNVTPHNRDHSYYCIYIM